MFFSLSLRIQWEWVTGKYYFIVRMCMWWKAGYHNMCGRIHLSTLGKGMGAGWVQGITSATLVLMQCLSLAAGWISSTAGWRSLWLSLITFQPIVLCESTSLPLVLIPFLMPSLFSPYNAMGGSRLMRSQCTRQETLKGYDWALQGGTLNRRVYIYRYACILLMHLICPSCGTDFVCFFYPPELQ